MADWPLKERANLDAHQATSRFRNDMQPCLATSSLLRARTYAGCFAYMLLLTVFLEALLETEQQPAGNMLHAAAQTVAPYASIRSAP